MGENRYIHSAEQDEMELERLRWQENWVDPPTIRHLETIGVSQGWRCLEAGAGAGSIAQWLSARVGATGKVVATDLNTRFLNLIRAHNLEIRQHNILRDKLEEAHYDLVHCRKLLMHLSEPERALKRIADAVRPGGWLLVEEDDYGSALSLDVTEPSAAAFTEVMKTYIGSVRRRGLVDFVFGRRVRGLVEGLGFVDVGQDGWTTVIHGGDNVARMHAPLSGSYPSTSKSLIAQGVFTMEQAEIMERTLMDSALYIPWYTIFSAWGRKLVEVRGT